MNRASLARPAAALVIALSATVAITWIEYRILHGTWRPPRSIVAGTAAERIESVCALTESDRGQLVTRPRTDLPVPCPSPFARCVDELAGIRLQAPESSDAPCAPTVWRETWAAALRHNAAARPGGLGTPASGAAIRFVAGNGTFEWVSYSTHEVENDWHYAVQLLFDVRASRPSLVRSQINRYQIAGLERTPIWLIGAVNFFLIVAPVGGRLLFTQRATWVRPLGFLFGIVLLSIGILLAAVSARWIVDHDPWLVIMLITAALSTAGAVLIVANGGRRVFPGR